MLSLHLTINGEGTEAYWPTNDVVQLEYSGPEGINLDFAESDGIRGAHIELSGELIEAMYWLYMKHNAPEPDPNIEIAPPEPPF